MGLKSVICVFGLRLDTCVFVCSYLLATRGDALLTDSRHARSRAPRSRETLRDGRGRGGRHTDLAAPHPAAPPRCTGPGRGTPPPRPLRTHRWAGPAAPLRPPLAPRAAPRLRLRRSAPGPLRRSGDRAAPRLAKRRAAGAGSKQPGGRNLPRARKRTRRTGRLRARERWGRGDGERARAGMRERQRQGGSAFQKKKQPRLSI